MEDLEAIEAYLSEYSEEGASRTIRRINGRLQHLARFPLSGRVVPEFELESVRELVEGQYRLLYLVKPDQLEVLRIVHGAARMGPRPR